MIRHDAGGQTSTENLNELASECGIEFNVRRRPIEPGAKPLRS
jgi:hypothetical protein